MSFSKLSSPPINTPFLPFSFPSSDKLSSISFLNYSCNVKYNRLSSTVKPLQVAASTTTNVTSSVMLESDDLSDPTAGSTAFIIHARNRIGLLQIITGVFKVLGLRVGKATVEFDGDYVTKTFYVTDCDGNRIEDPEILDKIKERLIDAIDGGYGGGEVRMGSTETGVVKKKTNELGEGKAKAERMFRLMDRFLKNDPNSLQKAILNHVEYTVARPRFSFDDFEAYQGLAHSVKDRLIERWHDTQMCFKRKDPKRVFFLSLEYLMGRSLLNSITNIGIRDQYADALSQLGFELEVLAEQEGDAALGNGGLARLSACQMDSLATLDYPAWGEGCEQVFS